MGLKLGIAAVLFCSHTAADAQQSQFNLTGVTVYEPADILSYAAQIAVQQGLPVTADVLADRVQTIYREDGYFLAEVFIASDGRTLVVDEGRVGEISIEGVDEPTFRLIRQYFDPVVGSPVVTAQQFERAIMLTEDLQSISATAEIDYPAATGPARVRVVAVPEELGSGSMTLDHPALQFGEAVTLTAMQRFLDVVAPGDFLRFEASGTREFDTGDTSLWGAVTYRAPLGGSGAYSEVYAGTVTAQRDATGTLESTDIEGRTLIAALGYPVIRDVETYGYALFELRRSETDVEAGGASFDSDVRTAGAAWIFGKTLEGGGAYEYALNLTYGERLSDASGFDDGDETFSYLRLGAGIEHPVGWFGPESTVRAEFWGQYSGDRLPRIEEFHLGGREDDRGYLFAEAQGDSGVSATVQISRDLFLNSGSVSRLRPFAFLDAGYVTNSAPGSDEVDEETFASLGIGLNVAFENDLSLRTYLANPLLDGPDTDAGDPAVYVGLTAQW